MSTFFTKPPAFGGDQVKRELYDRLLWLREHYVKEASLSNAADKILATVDETLKRAVGDDGNPAPTDRDRLNRIRSILKASHPGHDLPPGRALTLDELRCVYALSCRRSESWRP